MEFYFFCFNSILFRNQSQRLLEAPRVQDKDDTALLIYRPRPLSPPHDSFKWKIRFSSFHLDILKIMVINFDFQNNNPFGTKNRQ